MRNKDKSRITNLEKLVLEFSKETCKLSGVTGKAERNSFVRQIVDSIRRVDYVEAIRRRDICNERRLPESEMFDPLKAALLFKAEDNLDEAFWMVFIFTHFSKNKKTGWLLAREIYGGLGKRVWTWKRVSQHPSSFRTWIENNCSEFEGKFGNHRKYESLKPSETHGTGCIATIRIPCPRQLELPPCCHLLAV